MKTEQSDKLIGFINDLKDGYEIIREAEADILQLVEECIREKDPSINFEIIQMDKRDIEIQILATSSIMEQQCEQVRELFKEFNKHVDLEVILWKCYTQIGG